MRVCTTTVDSESLSCLNYQMPTAKKYHNAKGILSSKCASLISLHVAAMKLHHITKYTPAKTVEYLASDIPQISKRPAYCKKYLDNNKQNNPFFYFKMTLTRHFNIFMY